MDSDQRGPSGTGHGWSTQHRELNQTPNMQSPEDWGQDTPRTAMQKKQLSKTQSKRRRSWKAQKALPKSIRPGIKLDTSVTNNRRSPPKKMSMSQSEESPLNLSSNSARTNSLRGNAKHTSQEGLLIHISPSDRIIPIGLSIPESQAQAHMLTQPSPIQLGNIDLPPLTPTILITPARDGLEWEPETIQDVADRPRATSSIYSRPTTFIRATEFGQAPPVPAIPRGLINSSGSHHEQQMDGGAEPERRFILNRDSTMTAFEEDDDVKLRKRAESSATLFEEDERRPGSRRFSKRAHDLTIETSLPTPKRSSGWWNYITTPFEHNRGTFKNKSPVSATDEAPPVPVLHHAAPISGAQEMQKKDKKSYNDSPQSECSEFSMISEPDNVSSKPQPSFSLHINVVQHSQHSHTITVPPLTNQMLAQGTAQVKKSLEFNQEPIVQRPEAPRQRLKEAGSIQVVTANNTSSNAQGLKPKRASEYSLFSPNDREVPIMLDSDAESAGPSPQIFQQTPPPVHGPERHVTTQTASALQNVEPCTADHVLSPLGSDSAFSPGVVSLAAVAPMISTRTVEARTVYPPTKNQQKGLPLSQLPSTSFSQPSPHGDRNRDPENPPEPSVVKNEASRAANKPAFTHHTLDISVNDKRKSSGNVEFGTYFPPKPENHLHYDEAEKKKGKGWLSFFSGKKLRKKEDTTNKKKRSKKRCCCICCLVLIFVIMITLVITLAVTLTRRKHSPTNGSTQNPTPITAPTKVEWLTVSGYPPMPTGIVTIAQPDLRFSQSNCVTPSTLWSCAVPKEQQSAIAPNSPDQPNFRVEIVHNATGSALIPSPAAPNLDEQKFIGNTTDNNALPFEGEQAPFFISFLPTVSNPSRLRKRVPLPATTSQAFPDVLGRIPDPDVKPDGTAQAANLLPFPSGQPVRLYNRGSDREHYGFYTYFDKSIFLKNKALVDNSTDFSNIPADQDGGSAFDSARVRCTWAQTRFLVQIWTRMGDKARLLPKPSSTNTAGAFARPGTFPYPISITLDRHGGDTTKKLLYCYGMDESGRILVNEKKATLENKAFGGTIQNPTIGPFQNVTVSPKLGGPGGIDGGTGGCGCRWENFLKI